MKYDALHNRQFLETIFDPDNDPERSSESPGSKLTSIVNQDGNCDTHKLPKLRELYHLAKVLFEYSPANAFVTLAL